MEDFGVKEVQELREVAPDGAKYAVRSAQYTYYSSVKPSIQFSGSMVKFKTMGDKEVSLHNQPFTVVEL